MAHNLLKIFMILCISISNSLIHGSSDTCMNKNFESEIFDLLADVGDDPNQESLDVIADFAQEYESSFKKYSLIKIVGAIEPYVILQVDAQERGNVSHVSSVCYNMYELQSSFDEGDTMLYYAIAKKDNNEKLQLISQWHAGQDFKDRTTWTIFMLNKNIQEIIL